MAKRILGDKGGYSQGILVQKWKGRSKLVSGPTFYSARELVVGAQKGILEGRSPTQGKGSGVEGGVGGQLLSID